MSRRPLKNSEYKIYKFDFTYSKSKASEEKQTAVRWERANELTKFKQKMIDELNHENFNELRKYTLWAEPLGLKKEEYVSPRNYPVFDCFEIGLDMLNTKFGLLNEYHWNSLYFLVPLNQPDLINFFENNKPSWVTNVSKI